MESENILATFYGGHLVINPLLVAKKNSDEFRGVQAHMVSVLDWVHDENKLTFSKESIERGIINWDEEWKKRINHRQDWSQSIRIEVRLTDF